MSRVGRFILAICSLLTALVATGFILTVFWGELGLPVSTEASATSTLTYRSVRQAIYRHLFHIDVDQAWINPAFDVGFLWLTTFVTLNVFSLSHDGLTVWGHIRENHCRLTGPKDLAQFVCTLGRTVRVIALSPLMLLYATVRATFARQKWYSLLDLTFAPREVLRYFRNTGLCIVLFVIAAVYVLKKL